ncbi:MAG: DUF6339 family protein [Elusimicrobiales bacterium]|nr:DUF6339 family protein [Elusimicrobiales bacterium]
MSQPIFKASYISRIKSTIGRNTKSYLKGDWPIDKDDLLVKKGLKEINLNAVGFLDYEGPGKLSHDCENSIKLFEFWKDMDPTQATDIRLWTYLCHGPFMGYLRKRRPIEKEAESRRAGYIVDHWFVQNPGAGALKTNDLFLFWWGAYITYDKDRTDPYQLTKELFSMLDYTRHLLPGTQGRNRAFTHAVLEYVIENPELFARFKEGKVRLIMRRLNLLAGYRALISLNKQEIKEEIDIFRKDIQAVDAEGSTVA